MKDFESCLCFYINWFFFQFHFKYAIIYYENIKSFTFLKNIFSSAPMEYGRSVLVFLFINIFITFRATERWTMSWRSRSRTWRTSASTSSAIRNGSSSASRRYGAIWFFTTEGRGGRALWAKYTFFHYFPLL